MAAADQSWSWWLWDSLESRGVTKRSYRESSIARATTTINTVVVVILLVLGSFRCFCSSCPLLRYDDESFSTLPFVKNYDNPSSYTPCE